MLNKVIWSSLSGCFCFFLCFFFFLLFLCFFFGFLFLLFLFRVVKFLFKFFQTSHCDFGSSSYTGGELESTSCEGRLASTALPNSSCCSSDLWLNNDTNTLPQAGQTYLARCCNSNFLTIFLIAEPYLVPYFPVTPTFLVLLAIITNIK